jgi:hypothetical protein
MDNSTGFVASQEMGDGDLGHADWMGEVYVQKGVMTRSGIFFGRRIARRMPEVGKWLTSVSIEDLRLISWG